MNKRESIWSSVIQISCLLESAKDELISELVGMLCKIDREIKDEQIWKISHVEVYPINQTIILHLELTGHNFTLSERAFIDEVIFYEE